MANYLLGLDATGWMVFVTHNRPMEANPRLGGNLVNAWPLIHTHTLWKDLNFSERELKWSPDLLIWANKKETSRFVGELNNSNLTNYSNLNFPCYQNVFLAVPYYLVLFKNQKHQTIKVAISHKYTLKVAATNDLCKSSDPQTTSDTIYTVVILKTPAVAHVIPATQVVTHKHTPDNGRLCWVSFDHPPSRRCCPGPAVSYCCCQSQTTLGIEKQIKNERGVGQFCA